MRALDALLDKVTVGQLALVVLFFVGFFFVWGSMGRGREPSGGFSRQHGRPPKL